ncbi:hypothetical protein [Wenjunlia tyrosinilytica]|uniref:Uncharacterized protein n=1 Tax=Wenjunlia tyrosinilytica TaxID=1544741 RepID=A0A917ZPZ2_9ACTN|nr:hypothetical protein [Wenjunlia tyrosinilytica]GGO87472.1 hypothetical protein GCM10012280_26000 [Wenjunlia tyrosinilytica]
MPAHSPDRCRPAARRRHHRTLRTAVITVALAAGVPTTAYAAPTAHPAAQHHSSSGRPTAPRSTAPRPSSATAPPAGARAAAEATPFFFTDFSASTWGTSYGLRDITFVGRLMKHDPDGGPDVPAANETVDVVQKYLNDEFGDPVPDEWGYASFGVVRTDAKGRFELDKVRVTHRDLEAGGPVIYHGSFPVRAYAARRVDPRGPSAPANWDALDTWGDMDADTSQARMTADFVKGPVRDGAREVTVEGTFTRKDGPLWRPLKGFTTTVTFEPEDPSHEPRRIKVRTDGDGAFSAEVPVREDGSVLAAVHWWEDVYLDITGEQTQGVPVGIPDPLELRSGPYGLDRDRVVSASVALVGRGDCDAGGQRAALQWSADGRTGWKKVAEVRTDEHGKASVKVPGSANGYYRWHHAETDSCAGDIGYAKPLRRVETRVRDFDASPEPVDEGGKLLVEGVLQHKPSGGGWAGYGGRAVQIWFRPSGSGTWQRISTVASDARGRFAGTVTAARDGYWRAVHVGDATHFSVTGPSDYVDVR